MVWAGHERAFQYHGAPDGDLGAQSGHIRPAGANPNRHRPDQERGRHVGEYLRLRPSRNRKLAVPTDVPYLRLSAPSRELWEWNPTGSGESDRGQRRRVLSGGHAGTQYRGHLTSREWRYGHQLDGHGAVLCRNRRKSRPHRAVDSGKSNSGLATLMITESMFVLAVPNLEVSEVSYRDVFGFKIQENGDPVWRLFVRDSMSDRSRRVSGHDSSHRALRSLVLC